MSVTSVQNQKHISNPMKMGTSGFFQKVGYEESIRQNILAVCFTEPGERFMAPEVGVPLRSYQWDTVDKITFSAIRTYILQQLSLYEPRIEVQKVIVEGRESREGDPSSDIYISVEYRILSLRRADILSAGIQIGGNASS